MSRLFVDIGRNHTVSPKRSQPSFFSPRATIFNEPSGNGRCSFMVHRELAIVKGEGGKPLVMAVVGIGQDSTYLSPQSETEFADPRPFPKAQVYYYDELTLIKLTMFWSTDDLSFQDSMWAKLTSYR